MTHYLLTILAQKPTWEFERPRWHVDRRFFQAPDLSRSLESSAELNVAGRKGV
jgi:hypothetical protein